MSLCIDTSFTIGTIFLAFELKSHYTHTTPACKHVHTDRVGTFTN